MPDINSIIMANYHITYDHQNKKWRAIQEGKQKAAGLYDTKAEAEKASKEFCHNSGGGEVRIHNMDGKISDSDTIPPGNDPYPPKDTVY